MPQSPQHVQCWGDAAGFAISPEMPEVTIGDTSIPIVVTSFSEMETPHKASMKSDMPNKACPRLVLTDQSKTQTVELGDASIVLGREQPGSIKICAEQYPTVSSRHAMVEVSGNNFYISDLGSSNGTFVNRQKLTAKQKLHHSDEIQLGATGPKIKYLVN